MQISVLGTTLFFINIDVLDQSIETQLKKFAKVTKFFAWVKNTEQALSLQHTLDSLLKCNLVLLNQQVYFMCCRGNPSNFEYSIGGLPLEEVIEEKDVGVRVAESLKLQTA